MGGRAAVAGRPSRTAAVGASRRASTSALMKCVVPIITAVTAAGSNARCACRLSRAWTMPAVTSSLVGDFVAARTVVPSSRTASVFVPPTSIPMRTFAPVDRGPGGSVLRGRSGPPRLLGLVHQGLLCVLLAGHADAADEAQPAGHDVAD